MSTVTNTETKRSLTLYECAQMFMETMNAKFGPDHDGCIFMVVSDCKNKFTQLISGDDKDLVTLLANLAQDEEAFRIMAKALMVVPDSNVTDKYGEQYNE